MRKINNKKRLVTKKRNLRKVGGGRGKNPPVVTPGDVAWAAEVEEWKDEQEERGWRDAQAEFEFEWGDVDSPASRAAWNRLLDVWDR